jgi:hypothetical protein
MSNSDKAGNAQKMQQKASPCVKLMQDEAACWFYR